jgi:tetratricopeptide (TPR) repeat protein/MFS family permease
MTKVKTDSRKSISVSSEIRLSPYKAGATVFFSSACLMALEITAGRLTAQELGSSIYTWTSVIGVVLLGITIGSFAGGCIADRYTSRKSIANLFAVASISCVLIIVLSIRIGGWSILWRLSWPAYVMTYVTVLFLLPSILLGAIFPVAAKAALNREQGTGQTIGDIYAFGAAGSIAGTFVSGFWLISAIGIYGVIWSVAVALVVMGLIYNLNYRPIQVWAVLLAVILWLATAKSPEQAGVLLTLRTETDPNVIYDEQTQYSHIRVKRESERPEIRVFYQDKLKHSEIVTDDLNNLMYHYTRIYSTVTEQTNKDDNELSFLSIGGGGFVFPRYLRQRFPESRVDVAEIDPGVTRAALAAFGLSKDHRINIYTMDGRNFVDGLISKQRQGQDTQLYDYIYLDAFDNFSVPWQLLTRQLNENIAGILTDDGVYLLNLVDCYQSGLVIGSVLKTLEKTFDNVYILSPDFDYYNRTIFVVIASKQALDIDGLTALIRKYERNVRQLNEQDLGRLRDNSGSILLCDDYAPVDNLAAPIARQGGADLASQGYIATGRTFSLTGEWGKAVKMYMKAIDIYPTMALKSYFKITEDMLMHGEFQMAAAVCGKAIQYYDRPEIASPDLPGVNLNMGIAMKGLGQSKKTQKYLSRAIDGYQRQITIEPNSPEILANLGMALAETGRFAEAVIYFERAVEITPSNPEYRMMLVQGLIAQKNYAGAQKAINEAISEMKRSANFEAISGLQQLLGRVIYELSRPNPE